MNFTEHGSPEARANQARFEDLARRYHDDPELRAKIDSGDVADEIAFLGVEAVLPADAEPRIVVNSDEVYHLALPSDPNAMLGDDTLTNVSGGSTLGSAASVGSMSSFLCVCVPSSVGSAGTAGTAGSRAV